MQEQASGVLSTMMQIGYSMGIAFIGSIFFRLIGTGPSTAALTSGVILMKQIVMLEYNIILMLLLFQHCTL